MEEVGLTSAPEPVRAERPDRPDPLERERCQGRGLGRRVMGFQGWRDILFVHWTLPVDVVRPLVDSRLEVDTFDAGRAWITATPYTLVRGRLRGLPALPSVSTFHGLNLRTYVHRQGRDPGIWFFSLDAGSSIAAALARMALSLPFHASDIDRRTDGGAHSFQCQRRGSRAFFRARWSTSGAEQATVEGSLQDFLLGRFWLYSRHRTGRLVKQGVWHPPWRFFQVTSADVDENLSLAAGLPKLGQPDAAQFSRGVHVEFYFPERADRADV